MTADAVERPGGGLLVGTGVGDVVDVDVATGVAVTVDVGAGVGVTPCPGGGVAVGWGTRWG